MSSIDAKLDILYKLDELKNKYCLNLPEYNLHNWSLEQLKDELRDVQYLANHGIRRNSITQVDNNDDDQINNMFTGVVNIYTIIQNHNEDLLDLEPQGNPNKERTTLRFERLKEDECSICKEKYTNSSIVDILKCGHVFHKECIDRWLEEHNDCPYCRQ